MKNTKWFERNFPAGTRQNTFPSIIERLWGTPVRLEEKFRSLPENIQTIRYLETWSIKENTGHLTDLEPLWQGRLEDILNGRKELRATDLQNTRTSEANHNSKAVQELLSSFRSIRMKTVKLLQTLTEEEIFKTSLHPRMKTEMTTLDLFYFVAEHDDHHLARITELSMLLDR